MVEVKDILLKAAEDVQQGMWCTGFWFADEAARHPVGKDDALFNPSSGLSLEQALTARRCAEGSIAVATKLLGGSYDDYGKTVQIVNRKLPSCIGTGCGRDSETHSGPKDLFHFNDAHLPANDPFTAGQQLAELFRTTAESL